MRRRSPFHSEPTRNPSRASRQSTTGTSDLGGGTQTSQRRSPFSQSSLPSLQSLKQSVYSVWLAIAQLEDENVVESSPTADCIFKQQMRGFGDLRRRQTWEAAFAQLWARFLILTNDNNVDLIRSFVENSVPGWDSLAPAVLDAFLGNYNQAIVCLKNGIERLLNLPHCHPLILSFLNVLQATEAFQTQRFQFPQLPLPSAA